MAEIPEELESEVSLQSNDIEMRTIELEVVRSNIVSHASCSSGGLDVDAPCSTRHLSCPAKIELAEEQSSDKNPKTRKFKNIALPHWLIKPHIVKQRSHDEGLFGRHLHSKKRIFRTNSAPKTLGTSSSLKRGIKDQQCNTILEAKEEGLAVPEKKYERPKSPVMKRQQPSEDSKEKSKGKSWRRRASLPNHVGNNFNEIEVNESTQQIASSLTPKAERKQFNSQDKLEKDVLKALLFGRSNTGIGKNQSQQTINEESKKSQSTDTNHEDDINTGKSSDSGHHGNVKQTPHLQLHRLETPDLFFVPVSEEESDSVSLDRKLSNSTGELCTATKIDSEVMENELIKTLICQDLKNYLEGKVFTPDMCQKWCLDISQNIKTAVQNFIGDNYKLVCNVYIAALRGKGVHAAVQCVWTPDQDNFATASYKNDTLYAFGTIMATKYE